MDQEKEKNEVDMAKSRSPIASDIVQDAIKQCSKRVGKKITYKDLATKLEMNPSSLWFPIMRDRAWNVDRWLFTLQALGCLTFQGDHIIISSPKFEKHKKSFNKIDIL